MAIGRGAQRVFRKQVCRLTFRLPLALDSLLVTTRRRFLRECGSCAGHLALASTVMPLLSRRLWATPASGSVVAQEKFGRLEQVGEGVWALISTPLGGDYTTVSNGGIIAGRQGVLVIEGLQTPAGARWLASRARELTGRWPTHVVLSHYHGDHVNGVAGYAGQGALSVHATSATRALILQKNLPADAERTAALADIVELSPTTPTRLDLGGRMVTLVPRLGHTASDVTVELADPSVVFGGDLVWNAMFPNFVDASPLALAASVKALRGTASTRYVPGHGPLATDSDLTRYIAMLGEVETAARRAMSAGVMPAEAAKTFTLPASAGEWTLFSPAFYQRAFEAWRRELQPGG